MGQDIKFTQFDEQKLRPAYGITCFPAFGVASGGRRSTEFTYCRILPGQQTRDHAHYETEYFHIHSGRGLMVIDGHERPVTVGDLVHIPGFSQHFLRNLSQEENLDFTSIYSQSPEIGDLPANLLVTSAPPTPNGPLHLGHLSGPYLAADVASRYMALRGVPSSHQTGTDDFQNYVSGETAEKFRQSILEGLSRASIETATVTNPLKDQRYQKYVQSFFTALREKKVIRKEKLALPFCGECDRTLIDVHLSGKCAACGDTSSGACESCGIVTPAYKIVDPHCGRCGKAASTKEAEVYVFDLQSQLPHLESFHRELSKSNGKTADLLQRFTENGFSPLVVTHPGDWGIPVPGEVNQVIHVWFEMAAGYALLRENAQGDWVHTFGVDNSYYYLLMVPSLMKAFDPELRTYTSVIINEFLSLDGKKFSTSRDHAIWVNEFFEQEESDAVRLYLAKVRPENGRSDFTLDGFRRFKSDEFRRFKLLLSTPETTAEVGGEVSHLSTSQKAFIHRLSLLTRELEAAYHPETFSLTRAYRILEDVLIQVESMERDSQMHLIGKRVLAKLAFPLTPSLSSSYLKDKSPQWEKDVVLYV